MFLELLYPERRVVVRGQCRYCHEVIPKFSQLIKHEKVHKQTLETLAEKVPKVEPKDNSEIPELEIGNSNELETKPINPCISNTKISPSSIAKLDPDGIESINKNSTKESEGSIEIKIRLTHEVRISLKKAENDPMISDCYKHALNRPLPVRSRISLRKKRFRKKPKIIKGKHFKRIGPKSNLYECNICLIKVKRNSHRSHYYSKHMITSGFKCSICPAKFKYRDNKKRHESTVHGDIIKSNLKMYTCRYCNKSGFINKGDFGDHEAGHQGIKRYACRICSTRFICKSSLRKHLKKKHEEISPKKAQIQDEKNIAIPN